MRPKARCPLPLAEIILLQWAQLPGRYRKIILTPSTFVWSDYKSRRYPDACVIWVDAHADINTPETTDSGACSLNLRLAFHLRIFHRKHSWHALGLSDVIIWF